MVGWIYSVLASSAGAAALLGVVGILFRSQLAHWLNKDLEALKAVHQRDLEAYKVSLIAQAEAVKARQDVQKAMAIRMAERKFEAIDRLHRILEPRAREIVAALIGLNGVSLAERKVHTSKFGPLLQEAAEAASVASAFLTQDESKLMHRYIATLTAAAFPLMKDEYSVASEQLEQTKSELIALRTECFKVLDLHISRMLSMDEASS